MAKPATLSDQDIAKLSFEEAMARLDEIVRKLESGQTPLEESIELYGVGSALKAHCEAKLRAAEEKVEKILTQNGSIAAAPFDGS